MYPIFIEINKLMLSFWLTDQYSLLETSQMLIPMKKLG
jgi:hypothetical protein